MSTQLATLDQVQSLVADDPRIGAAEALASSVATMGYTIADADTRIAANDDLMRAKKGLTGLEDIRKECVKPANDYIALVRNALAPAKARIEASIPLIEEGMRKWDKAEAARVEAARREQQRIIDEQAAAAREAARLAAETGVEAEEPPPAAQVVVLEKPRVEQSRGGTAQTVIQRRVEATLEDAKALLDNPQWLYLLVLNATEAVKEYKVLAQRGMAPDFPGEGGVNIAGIRFTTKETYTSKGR